MKEQKKERLPVSVSSAVLITDVDGKLLLLKQAAVHKGGKWGPPAGGLQAHEDPVMAARREVQEEIGIDVNLVDLIGIYTVDRGDNSLGVGFVFRGELFSENISLKEGEIADYKYFTSQELRELIKTDMLYKPEYNLSCLEDWISGNSYPLEVIRK